MNQDLLDHVEKFLGRRVVKYAERPNADEIVGDGWDRVWLELDDGEIVRGVKRARNANEHYLVTGRSDPPGGLSWLRWQR